MISEDPKGFEEVVKQHHLPSEPLPIELVDPKKEEPLESDGKLMTSEKE